jgi:hypothetical protein
MWLIYLFLFQKMTKMTQQITSFSFFWKQLINLQKFAQKNLHGIYITLL